MGLLDGKVILITGAGNGLGRAHALACAREGAAVVVNDLGGARDGMGASHSAADNVVAEIQGLGGRAIANYDSVTDRAGCARMVKTATEAFGRLDALVNNAGILRDVTFRKMEDPQWDVIIDVHLNGTYNVTRAAVEALAASGGGAIINTTSYSGMIGNFGQSNYAAAKAGIYGLTRVLALELRKAGITANCVAPIAKTRMTEEIQMVDADWTPEQVSPIVVFLCSELGKSVTGKVFGVQGQRIHVYEMKMNDGVEKPGKELWTAQEIASKLEAITSFEAPAAAAPKAVPEQDIVSSFFAFFPAGFKKGKMPAWTATLHWVVKNGSNQTVSIANDTCTVAPGLNGTPTCTIKTDKDTLIAMGKGELAPEKAFMTGKASADNMGDLMKFAQCFDLKKVAQAWQAAGGQVPGAATQAAAPAPAGPSVVDEAFARVPGAFMPDKAGDFKATIHFVLKDGPGKTLQVAGGKAWVDNGLVGAPSCTVKTDVETIVGILTSTLDAQKAFMKGRITADNMSVLMKFAMYFRFDKPAAAATPAAQAPPPAPTEKARTWPIGKTWDGGFAFVEPQHVEAYAEATGDPNILYYGPGAVAPPMFHVRLFKNLMFSIATDPELELDLLRLVHGEHDAIFHKPLRAWDLVHLRARLEAVEEKSSGLLVVSRLYGFVDGEAAVEARTSYFIRGAKKAERAEAGPAVEAAAPPAPDFTVGFDVAADQSYQYAKASLDDNPIHVDPGTARAAGLPDVILQGLCTMAMAGRTVVQAAGGGDPRRLSRLGVRFAKPVLNGVHLTTLGWKTPEGVRFSVVGADGKEVISNGIAAFHK